MRMRLLSQFITLTFLLALVAPAQDKAAGSGSSATTTPVGRWQTVDDATRKIDSVVVLWEENGKLYGKIERLVDLTRTTQTPAASDARAISRIEA